MSTFFNTPTDPLPPKPFAELPKDSKAGSSSGTAFSVSPADSVPILHFREAPDTAVAKLNADLGLSLDPLRFARLQAIFSNSIKRDPTVGELRLLDALDQNHVRSPERIAVGELITQSETLAATWADMMQRHGILHGAGEIFRGKHPVAAPPCSLMDALSLEGRYLYRTGLHLPPVSHPSCEDSHSLLLSCPQDEAVAAAQGYTPVARIDFGEEHRSLWARTAPPTEEPVFRTGDFLLYLPDLSPQQVFALRKALDALPVPSAVLAAVAAKPLLLTALDICPSLDLYADRLTDIRKLPPSNRIPLELLCALPTPETGKTDHLLRVSLKQIKSVTQLLRDLGLTATICGQGRTGEQTVIRVRNDGSKEDIPVVRLPSEFLKATAAVYLHPFEVPRQTLTPPDPVFPPVSRLPSPYAQESGITPDGEDLTPITLHQGRLVVIPETKTLMSGGAVTIPSAGMGYAAAAGTAAAVTDTLLEAGLPSASMVLSVSVTVNSPSLLRDGRLIEIICGINRLAHDRSIPVDDPVIRIREDAEEDIRLSVVGWGAASGLDDPLLSSDRLWKSCGQPIHKEAPAFLLPFLSPAYEDSLKALCAALNRDAPSACSLLPVPLITPPAEGESEAAAPAMDPEGIRALCDGITGWATPVFAMSYAHAEMMLSEPTVREALNRKIHLGYSVIVLGEACRAFAKWGFLPPCLEDLTAIEAASKTATVIYRFEADSATRLLRCAPMAPCNGAQDLPHLLTLHLPDGQTIPDGFTYRDSRVLGLVNGLDVTLLPRLRCRNRFE